MPTTLSERVTAIKPSATLAVDSRAKSLASSGTNIVNLGVGEPDFDTPSFIREAAIAAINEGFTRYTPVDGIPELKQAICNKLSRDNQLDYEPNQILVSSGAKQSLYNAMQALLEKGHEVIIPAPYWVSYPDMVLLSEAQPVIITTDMQQHYKMTAEQLSAAITPKTRMLILNSPSNPTGSAYTKEELLDIANVLVKHPNIIILSDDIYEYIVWNRDNFTSILNVCPALNDRTIIVNGVSKAHAMTGWRIGYAAGPKDIIAAMKKLQSQSTSCPNSIAQKAATAALTADPNDFFPPMLHAYQERYDWLLAAINNIPGLSAIPTSGTFYLFVNVSAALQQLGLDDDITFATHLLEKAHVATIPGTAFGSPGHIRLSFATDIDTLRQGIERITAALKTA